MANPRAKEQMKAHWARCREIAKTIPCSPQETNRHWSCCLKMVYELGEAEWKRVYRECLLERAKHERKAAEYIRSISSAARRQSKRDPKASPDLAARIKIMLWAIEKCGGVEESEDAFVRAKRSLESPPEGEEKCAT